MVSSHPVFTHYEAEISKPEITYNKGHWLVISSLALILRLRASVNIDRTRHKPVSAGDVDQIRRNKFDD